MKNLRFAPKLGAALGGGKQGKSLQSLRKKPKKKPKKDLGKPKKDLEKPKKYKEKQTKNLSKT